jgi:hypothetical protein
MTTGRINQVTTFPNRVPAVAATRMYNTLSRRDFRMTMAFLKPNFKQHPHRKPFDPFPPNSMDKYSHLLNPAMETPCFSFSHILGCFTPSIKRRGSLPSVKTTSNRLTKKRQAAIAADLRVNSCNGFSHRQAIHTLQHCQPTLQNE